MGRNHVNPLTYYMKGEFLSKINRSIHFISFEIISTHGGSICGFRQVHTYKYSVELTSSRGRNGVFVARALHLLASPWFSKQWILKHSLKNCKTPPGIATAAAAAALVLSKLAIRQTLKASQFTHVEGIHIKKRRTCQLRYINVLKTFGWCQNEHPGCYDPTRFPGNTECQNKTRSRQKKLLELSCNIYIAWKNLDGSIAAQKQEREEAGQGRARRKKKQER